MAKWNTFKWSDGTKWADGAGTPSLFTSFIDQLAYHISVRLTHTAAAGSTTAPTIHTLSAELGPRSQLPDQFEAFVDRNEETQRVSVRINKAFAATDTTDLITEGGDTLITESSDSIILELFLPFSIDNIHILTNQRSRSQPVG